MQSNLQVRLERGAQSVLGSERQACPHRNTTMKYKKTGWGGAGRGVGRCGTGSEGSGERKRHGRNLPIINTRNFFITNESQGVQARFRPPSTGAPAPEKAMSFLKKENFRAGLLLLRSHRPLFVKLVLTGDHQAPAARPTAPPWAASQTAPESASAAPRACPDRRPAQFRASPARRWGPAWASRPRPRRASG